MDVTISCLGASCTEREGSPAAAAVYDANKADVIGYDPKLCPDGKNYCSMCQNISELWNSNSADPSWITFSQIFNATGAPTDIYPNNGAPIVSVRGQVFPGNQYHYFEFLVQNGDAYAGTDARRDNIFLTLVSPQSIPVAKGQVSTVSSVDSAKLPAYDFYVGQGCIPQEGSWNNQGYGNINANEKVKSINVNVTQDGRYFIALQSRKERYSVAAFDFTMKLSRGSMVARNKNTRCTQLVYRYPDEIRRMTDEFRQSGTVGTTSGSAIPYCGATPADKKFNIIYKQPPKSNALTNRQISIIVGGAGGGIVLGALASGLCLFVRYKRTTKRMAKFSSLSRGLPEALLDGEGQEVAV
ncbi:hypothetical protein GUITHDRAFT_117521 [Guillardia theta CCMP2712]|uniref:Uncharacterized protein n=1 Tax=Guillardia theta (strain CCMP2712) TaxID=905079 RepID=L1IJ77_GUITC|nr:hypothetical protein GUITHDRAFT_117521 [Guillardia theta CCMP2712]EKX36293.1 hypothetical protein GUITHDRAFT_117521 [Guillardia theta CCMP2712]|eukprot:XP_005823273.1 hypothetical protein GUITHDRAFT_117521 [Guillardia theta CCMP2712]